MSLECLVCGNKDLKRLKIGLLYCPLCYSLYWTTVPEQYRERRKDEKPK